MGRRMILKHVSSFNDNQDKEFRCTPMVQIGIYVKDMDKSIDFYVNNLGCKVKEQQDDILVLDFFGAELCLKEGKIKKKSIIASELDFFFGLNVHWDDWHKAIDHLNYIGIKYYKKPKVEIGSNDKTYASFSMKDPSGNILKFSSLSGS